MANTLLPNMEFYGFNNQLVDEDDFKVLPSQSIGVGSSVAMDHQVLVATFYENSSVYRGPPPQFDPSTIDYCGLGQACDQQCDPNSVVPCTSVDAKPCYDPTCSPRCELDGIDTSCYETHSYINPNDSRESFQLAGPAPPRTAEPSLPAQHFTPCSHPEHFMSGCINPQALMINPIPNPGLAFPSVPTIEAHSCLWKSEGEDTMCLRHCHTSAELQEHIEDTHLQPRRKRMRNGEQKPIMCHWHGCQHGNEFRQNQHLKDHMRTHTKDKPFICEFVVDGEICGNAFGERKALDSHMRKHTKEKPFQCPECDKTFAHQATLTAHLEVHKPAGAMKKYTCPKCGHQDNDRANLTRHVDTHFPPRYICKLCRKSFSKKANALRHLTNKSCKNCPEGMPLEWLKQQVEVLPREMGDLDFEALKTKIPATEE